VIYTGFVIKHRYAEPPTYIGRGSTCPASHRPLPEWVRPDSSDLCDVRVFTTKSSATQTMKLEALSSVADVVPVVVTVKEVPKVQPSYI
jgi:hypothetical protein